MLVPPANRCGYTADYCHFRAVPESARAADVWFSRFETCAFAMASVMKSRLQQNGITVTGQPRVERVPVDANAQTIAEKETSLVDLLAYMNKHSDNYLAESMFRKLSTIQQIAASAPDARARENSCARGCRFVMSMGRSARLIDGSGLSRGNQVTANTVINLLAGIKQQGIVSFVLALRHTLSVAGYDGTLRNRMIGTPAQFNAHGKTGNARWRHCACGVRYNWRWTAVLPISLRCSIFAVARGRIKTRSG